ncbi:MAG: phospholipid carrier-dependent glycosyltransferase [Calothrix sp. MO_167.B12]|nr:phospholipid carrier-dependent glycosyltransferase [Calothrix sp. MO_167.B12]
MTKKYFCFGLTTIFILSILLRFWGLDRFNTLVFDEVYYAKFGSNYLTNTPFFDGHPPLAKYIIASGIWLGTHLPFFPTDIVNGLSGSLLSPWHYRWLNAFTGSFIPLIIAAIAYQLSRRRSFSFLAGLFTACDGIFLVESRYALINQYIVIFGLLAQWLFLLALASEGGRRRLFLVFSGISFGAAISCKWNGLSFLLGIYLIWLFAWGWQWIMNKYQLSVNQENTIHPLQKITQIKIYSLIFYLGIIPLIIYSIIWIPHLKLDVRYDFIEVHKQILQFHKGLGGNTSDIHPYCAAWYTWPLMIRPIAYYYQTASSFKDPLPVWGPPLPSGSGKVIYDVHAMGNPFLWWFGLTALLFLLIVFVWQFAIPTIRNKNKVIATPLTIDIWISLFLLFNYAVNLFPWATVHRCVFMYHYMTSVVFAFLAIAWLVDKCLASYNVILRGSGVTITFIILIAFIFWLPIYLGLPLSPEAYKMRMWFSSWI